MNTETDFSSGRLRFFAVLDNIFFGLCFLNRLRVGWLSETDAKPYRHRFAMTIIQHSVWLYHRFPLSERDVQELLHQRGNCIANMLSQTRSAPISYGVPGPPSGKSRGWQTSITSR